MRFQPSRMIILFLLSLACILQAAETERHSFREAYADPDTGVSFPAEIGCYRKTEVVRSFNPRIGTVIRYVDSDGGCADIYIYSLDSSKAKVSGESFRKHYDHLRKTIQNLSKKTSHVTDIKTLGEAIYQKPPLVSGRQVFFRMKIAGELHNSDLTVFPYADKIIKIRISTPSYYSSGEKNHLSFFTEYIANLFNTADKTEKNKKN